jgi:hypothetical protein
VQINIESCPPWEGDTSWGCIAINLLWGFSSIDICDAHPARRRCRCWRRAAGCPPAPTRRSTAADPPPVRHPPLHFEYRSVSASQYRTIHVLPQDMLQQPMPFLVAAAHGAYNIGWRRTSLTGMSRAPWMPLAALGEPGAAAPSRNPAGTPPLLDTLSQRKDKSVPGLWDLDAAVRHSYRRSYQQVLLLHLL